MAGTLEWSKGTWESSVSGRCWNYTPYDEGWDHCADLRNDAELQQIVFMEREIAPLPQWAHRVVVEAFQPIPPCGHHRFPRAFLEAVTAIGAERPPGFVHGCFAVDPERKNELRDYVACLEAWRVGKKPWETSLALERTSARKIDWRGVCIDVWGVLGERTEMKALLVERLVMMLDEWIERAPWDGDGSINFGRVGYPGFDSLGDVSERAKAVEARLAELCPDWERFRTLLLAEWWLCAPKAFRFLERKLWFIGKGAVPEPAAVTLPGSSPWWTAFVTSDVPDFLRAADTFPDAVHASAWWTDFCAALDGWWRDDESAGAVAQDVAARLGAKTPVKRWLVRLFLRRIRAIEENGERFARLVRAV